nr:MAG TPA: hypothetical protein [Caudoviricetes sp.]
MVVSDRGRCRDTSCRDHGTQGRSRLPYPSGWRRRGCRKR